MRMKINLRAKLLLQFITIGVLPLLVMGGLAYQIASSSLERSSFEKLSSVRSIKKSAISRYFQTIQDQIVTFSENKMVIDAARSFRSEFQSVIEENEIDEEKLSQMKKELYKYYSGPFLETYRKSNETELNVRGIIDQLDPATLALQYYYITDNENPLGNKHKLNRANDQSNYSKTHEVVHGIIRDYLEKFGYYDIFLIDKDSGHVIYSVFKELDYGTSLLNGPYKNTNFAKVFKKALTGSTTYSSFLVDFEQYTPSYEYPASFIASPVFDGDEMIAVAVFQMPIDRINAIMAEKEGMGESGETFIVGSDRRFRSDSRLASDRFSVENSFRKGDEGQIDAPEIDLALSGKQGEMITKSYLGVEVLSSFSPLEIMGLKWAFIAQQSTKEAFAPVKNLAMWMGGIGIIATLCTIFIGWFVGRSIANPILKLAGDLDSNAKLVSKASDGLAGSSNQLSELATEQASSIEETAASIEEISAMVKKNVEQAEHSSKLSLTVKEVADKGNESMSHLIRSMQEITDSNREIQDLVKVIGGIGDKTEIIDEIVFQTKLLSFNASVEAERAGEHGRGFAVVAQEVGNLAQMSGKAALEIASMVKSSIRNAEEITDQNKRRVENGNALVKETAKFLEEIAKDAESLLNQAQQIVTSSKEQSDGITQVNLAMSQLDQATQQNSQTAELTATSSEQLASQAEQLKANLEYLLEFVNGTARGKDVQTLRGEAKTDPLSAKKAVVLPLNKPAKPQVQPLKQVVGQSGFSHGEGEAESGDDHWEKL